MTRTDAISQAMFAALQEARAAYRVGDMRRLFRAQARMRDLSTMRLMGREYLMESR